MFLGGVADACRSSRPVERTPVAHGARERLPLLGKMEMAFLAARLIWYLHGLPIEPAIRRTSGSPRWCCRRALEPHPTLPQ